MQFRLAETYTMNQSNLLQTLNGQLATLTQFLHVESNTRRKVESDYSTLLQRFTELSKLYAVKCCESSAVSGVSVAGAVSAGDAAGHGDSRSAAPHSSPSVPVVSHSAACVAFSRAVMRGFGSVGMVVRCCWVG